MPRTPKSLMTDPRVPRILRAAARRLQRLGKRRAGQEVQESYVQAARLVEHVVREALKTHRLA